MENAILFDTHVFIWLLSGDLKISNKVIELIEERRKTNSIYLADISLWEICMLVKKERITLDQPILSWLKNAIKNSGVHLIHITPEVSVESIELPGNFHGDPADRLIVATARVFNLTILTRDKKIIDYSKENRLHALEI